ncbi:uncharacterized protein BKCO1_4200042 [Diplodia corticola]|uniref:Uncharacterized protein n=1 Tax=Diplodia corticola TaxID=236234 RepID=A0A1J9QVL2_9PEZI|nr:uncharacterized protein BKCO1_4200042 [Diplodia corticola]OJD32034.1 hypothetical protein BKCO1_4200042 [Diplodia corticola]
MPIGARATVLLTTLAVAPPAYYAVHTAHRLEAKYPRLQPSDDSTSTPALRTPDFPITHHTPHVDIYGGKVPARALADYYASDDDGRHGHPLSPHEAWARFFLESPALRLEGRLFGGFSTRNHGDAGERGFHPGQKLLNGVLEVVRAPSPSSSSPSSSSSLLSSRFLRPIAAAVALPTTTTPQPLLVRWTCPPAAVGFFHTAAVRWGYPWRLMSGGRHEFAVVSDGEPDAEGLVEVRFGCAHDYERVAEEGKDQQKTIPGWVARLHRVYAMWLLDERIEALKRWAAAAEEAEAAGPEGGR